MRVKEGQIVLVWKCNGCNYVKGYSLQEEGEGEDEAGSGDTELERGEPCSECGSEYYLIFPCDHNATIPLDGEEIGNELCSDCGVVIEASKEERLGIVDYQIQETEKQLEKLKSIREQLLENSF
ncbi:MAG: hypothetical protein R6U44_04975 [Archaeoglobaceae archaeon]